MDLPLRMATVDAHQRPPIACGPATQPLSSLMPHAFDRLPAELMTLILSQIDSPKDLGAFIRTCQRTYRVFQAHKTSVLQATIRNAFPGAQLSEAAGACKTWPLKAAHDHGQWMLLLPAQQWFLRQYWLNPTNGHVDLKEPGLLLALYRLWWVLNQFVQSFFDDSMQHIATEIDAAGLQPGWSTRPDSHERLRIQRALTRYELYRQLFPPLDGPQWSTNDWPYRSTHQYAPTLFLRQMPHWERAELLEVSQYLSRSIRGLHLRIRQELLHMVPPHQQLSGESVDRERPVLPVWNEHGSLVRLFETLFIFPDDDERFKRQYSCIARLGLPFIRWLHTLSLADQVYVLGLHWATAAPKTMEAEMSYVPRSDMSLEKWISAMKSSSLDGPSVGWREIFENRVSEEGLSTVMTGNTNPLLPSGALETMGYLFWSKARFERIAFPRYHAPEPEPVPIGLIDGCDMEESKALQVSLRCCALRSETFGELWRSLEHSNELDLLADCFTRSYPPKKVLAYIPLYYGLIMGDDESAHVARRFAHQRRNLVNELVSRLSDIWLELVTTAPQ